MAFQSWAFCFLFYVKVTYIFYVGIHFFRDLRDTIVSAQKESKFYVVPHVKNACLGLISLYAKFH
jgi:hypothetical protein